MGVFEGLDLYPAQTQEEQALAGRLDFCGMAGMDRRDLLKLLLAGSTDRDELLRALQLLVIGDEHRLHRDIFRVGLRQCGAEEGRQERRA
jgi:hypothetical protein